MSRSVIKSDTRSFPWFFFLAVLEAVVLSFFLYKLALFREFLLLSGKYNDTGISVGIILATLVLTFPVSLLFLKVPKKSRGSKLTKAVFFLFLSVVVFCAAAELLVNVIFPGPSPMKFLETVGYNTGGFRDYEHALEAKPGTARILGIGDSFTFGFGVPDDGDIYLSRIERGLNEKHPGRFEVINMSRPGMQADEELKEALPEGLKYKPNLVILGYCVNDVDARGAGERFREHKYSIYDNYLLYSFKTAYLYFMLKSRAGAALGVYSDPASFYKAAYEDESPKWRNMEKVVGEGLGILREAEIPVVVLIFPLYLSSRRSDKYPFGEAHEKVAALFRKNGATVIDLLPVFSDHPREKLMISGFDGHPSVFAHSLAADVLVGSLRDGFPDLLSKAP